MELLYRGEKRADELLSDYIERLANMNGFSGSKAFKKHLKRYYSHQSWFGSYENQQGRNDKWLVEGLLGKYIPPDVIKPVRVYEGGIWLRESRKCLECYREAPYIRFYWRLKACRYCHVHNQELAEQNGEESVIHEEVVLKTLKYYEGAEQIQRFVLLEMSFLDYELELLSDLVLVLSIVSEYREKLDYLQSKAVKGTLVGLSPQDRVDHMAELLSKDRSSKEAIVRLIILVIIFNESPYAGYKNNSFKECAAQYKKYAAIFIGFDPLLNKIYKQDNLDSVNNITQIDVLRICNPIADDERLAREVKSLIYFGKFVKGWEKETNFGLASR